MKVALDPLRELVPKDEVPSIKVTVPVGVPEALHVMVAVKVTDWPKVDGLSEDCKEVEVAFFDTTWVRIADVLPAKLLSPPYTAVIECEPRDSAEVDNVALPAASVPVPRLVAPS